MDGHMAGHLREDLLYLAKFGMTFTVNCFQTFQVLSHQGGSVLRLPVMHFLDVPRELVEFRFGGIRCIRRVARLLGPNSIDDLRCGDSRPATSLFERFTSPAAKVETITVEDQRGAHVLRYNGSHCVRFFHLPLCFCFWREGKK